MDKARKMTRHRSPIMAYEYPSRLCRPLKDLVIRYTFESGLGCRLKIYLRKTTQDARNDILIQVGISLKLDLHACDTSNSAFARSMRSYHSGSAALFMDRSFSNSASSSTKYESIFV